MKVKYFLVWLVVGFSVLYVGFNRYRTVIKNKMISARTKQVAELVTRSFLLQNRELQVQKAVHNLLNFGDTVPPILLDASIKKYSYIEGFDYILTIQYIDESKSVSSISLRFKENEISIDSVIEPMAILGSYELGTIEHGFMVPISFDENIESIDNYWKNNHVNLYGFQKDKLLKKGNADISLLDIKGKLLDSLDVLIRDKQGTDK